MCYWQFLRFYLVVLGHSTARQLMFVLVPTAALSVALAYADFVFVNSYRDWVQKTIIPLQRQGFRVWAPLNRACVSIWRGKESRR